MIWELQPDEALIVEMDDHDGFWIFGMGGVFVDSMDFLYRAVSYTPARTKVDTDDVVRLVLAHDDPGVHNWLDTQGFSNGNLTYRNLMSQNVATFRTRLVKRAERSRGAASRYRHGEQRRAHEADGGSLSQHQAALRDLTFSRRAEVAVGEPTPRSRLR